MRLDVVRSEPQVRISPLPSKVGVNVSLGYNDEIDNPLEQDILLAVEKVYAEEIDAVILSSDVENNLFMQLPCGGIHIEYCVGIKGPVYSAEDVSLDMAKRLFISYANNDETWKTAVDWKVEIDEL